VRQPDGPVETRSVEVLDEHAPILPAQDGGDASGTGYSAPHHSQWVAGSACAAAAGRGCGWVAVTGGFAGS
jgi:hypothetical protein